MDSKFRANHTCHFLKQLQVFLGIFVSVLLLQGNSQLWSQEQITVDGDESDWHEDLTDFEGKDLSLGVKNDGEFLYICLVSTDRMLRRQL